MGLINDPDDVFTALLTAYELKSIQDFSTSDTITILRKTRKKTINDSESQKDKDWPRLITLISSSINQFQIENPFFDLPQSDGVLLKDLLVAVKNHEVSAGENRIADVKNIILSLRTNNMILDKRITHQTWYTIISITATVIFGVFSILSFFR